MEFARAYLLKNMMKKALAESAFADGLRRSTSSAHISGQLMMSTTRISHLSLPLIYLVRAHERAVQSVLEREFGKCLFSLPLICM